MPYCINCGKLLRDTDRFCTACGTPVEGPEPPVSDVEAHDDALVEPATADKTQLISNREPADATRAEQAPAAPPAAEPPAPEPAKPSAEPDPLEYRPDELPTYSIPARGPEITQRMPRAATAPAPSPTATAPVAATPTAAAAQAPTPKRPNAPLIVIICLLLAVIIALVVIFVVKPFGNTDSTAASTATEQTAKKKSEIKEPEVKGDPNAPGKDSSDDEDADKVSEKNIYTQVKNYYDKLSGYDQQVRDCASTFNTNYLSSDYSTRSSASKAAFALEDELDDMLDDVKDLEVPTSSKNYSSWKDTVTLYEDLEHRIEVICDAWNLSLSYSDPSAHNDEIVAPLARDNVSGTNDNKYRLDYEQRYAGAAPVEVE